MDSISAALAEQYAQISEVELAAVLLAIGYLLLAIRQNIWCWFCAAISTAIYVVLFAQANLYMESLLNVFYFGMAIYGWRVWTHGRAGQRELPVARWSLNTHVIALTVIVVLSLATGFLLERRTDAAFPYVDSLTTYAAIWATYLVVRKVLENWWYWLVIDLMSIVIYWSRDLELTAFLFVVYVILIPFGLAAWTRSFRNAPPIAETA